MKMPKKNDSTEGEEKSVSLSETLKVYDNIPQISRWERYIPYPSDIGLINGEYIPQPQIQITVNNDWLRSKLHAIRQVSEEIRWIVRLAAAMLIIFVVVTDIDKYEFATNLLRELGILLAVLFFISAFSFRVVVHSEPAEVKATAPNPTVGRSCPKCGNELGDNSDSCSNCGWESDNPINT